MTKLLHVEDNDDNVYMLKMRLELWVISRWYRGEWRARLRDGGH